MSATRKPSTSSSIWTEPLELLARRWEARESSDGGVPSMAGEDLASAARKRAAAVVRATGITPVGQASGMKRRWDLTWNPEEREKSLASALRKLGWRYRLATEKGSGEGVLVVSEIIVEERAKAFKRLACPYNVDAKTAFLIVLAGELFQIAAAIAGRAPAHPAVDEVACHVFVQDVLGLPFNPWAIDLV